ncbi:hypothetical protein BKA83DRAFT_4173789 [Pisolithus microcarpus]|nr:hypothetical protein BKA83DRAFT_4173789 [Pisolithus microcarpus]
MSASSFDTTSSLAFSSPPRSPATSLSPSLRDREQERGGESPTVPGNPHNSMTRESSPALETSWASLLDRTALEGIPAFISTEAVYVRDLQLIVEVTLLFATSGYAREGVDIGHILQHRGYRSN